VHFHDVAVVRFSAAPATSPAHRAAGSARPFDEIRVVQEPMMPKKTIMIVDDDADVRDAVADLLEGHGYAVIPASNGQEALNELKAGQKPSLILLDVMMPIMDGQAFTAEQQADPELSDIPVVVFTAFGAALDKMKDMESFARIEKPVQADKLLDSVDRWTGPSKLPN
jgi:CheY-like chemotaxis protein